MKHYTYKTTNLTNGKFYLGKHSTEDIDDGYLGSGTTLKCAIKKHGRESFKIEILTFYDTEEETYEAEKILVTTDMINDKNCYNQQMGGYGSEVGPSEERVQRGVKTRQKKLERKIKDTRIYSFDITSGRMLKTYPNVFIAAKVLGLSSSAPMAIRRCASEDYLDKIIYYGLYWSYTKKIPEKCYTKGSFIEWRRRQPRNILNPRRKDKK